MSEDTKAILEACEDVRRVYDAAAGEYTRGSGGIEHRVYSDIANAFERLITGIKERLP